MTKNKALKAAARERAAQTGERYVVARRAVAIQPQTRIEGVLHRLTHRVRGVPVHIEGGLQTRPNRPHRPTTHAQPTHMQPQHGEPRVLVGLQHRIARLFRAE